MPKILPKIEIDVPNKIVIFRLKKSEDFDEEHNGYGVEICFLEKLSHDYKLNIYDKENKKDYATLISKYFEEGIYDVRKGREYLFLPIESFETNG